jgi:hypothetical protein
MARAAEGVSGTDSSSCAHVDLGDLEAFNGCSSNAVDFAQAVSVSGGQVRVQ